MNIISDYAAHKRDEEFDAGGAAQRQWRNAPKCSIHGIPLIAGRGWVDPKTGESHSEIFPGGACPDCLTRCVTCYAELDKSRVLKCTPRGYYDDGPALCAMCKAERDAKLSKR